MEFRGAFVPGFCLIVYVRGCESFDHQLVCAFPTHSKHACVYPVIQLEFQMERKKNFFPKTDFDMKISNYFQNRMAIITQISVKCRLYLLVLILICFIHKMGLNFSEFLFFPFDTVLLV